MAIQTAAVSTAEPLAVLSANAGTVWSVALDPPGDTVAMATEDGTVRLWDWPTKSVKATMQCPSGRCLGRAVYPKRRTAGDGWG